MSNIESLKKDIIKRQDEITSLKNHIIWFDKDSDGWCRVNDQIIRKDNANMRDFEELQKLQCDDTCVEIPYAIIDCDEKLAVAAEDIKEMKTDCCKFSKTISEFV